MKIFSSILISFIFFTNLIIPISLFSAETIWNYKETTTLLPVTHGPFKTEKECLDDLASLKLKSPLIKIEACLSSIIAGYPIPDPNPKQQTPIPITPKINVAENKSIYKMLAPIGGITCMDSSDNPDPKCIPNDIGKYLNIIFKLAIGVSAALAVIMLILNGVKYMGDESVFRKTEAKSKMFSAIAGLLIALGAWALLNTINPALTGQNGLNISSADIQIEPLYDRGANDPKNSSGESVRCTPVTNTSSPCTIANLTKIFGAENAEAMSKICNMESGGTSIASGTDVCKPTNTNIGTTNPFSFGLFQVNLAANGILAGSDCIDLFDKKVSAKDVIEPRYSSGYSCKILSGKEALYVKCRDILLDPNKNLAIAKDLFTKYKKQPWIGDKKYCASAFK